MGVAGGRARLRRSGGQAASRDAIFETAERYGAFGPRRLDVALRTLVERGCLVDLEEGRLRITPTGRIAAAKAPTT